MSDLDYLINFNSNTSGIDSSRFAISKLGAAMAALGVGFGASELAGIADEFSNLSSRIGIAVGETGDFEGAMTGVKEVALATNSNLSATGQLFTKINDAGKALGLTQQDSLELTETINKAMQLGGGAASSNEAAIIQLTQALSSGVLRGDEFNSIMEQAPGISKALAASLGVTTGELRTMANEGKLSSQTVISALQEQSATIESEYAKLPTTVDQALQNIRTQWAILIGEFNQDSGATSNVVEWLGVLEENMALLDTVLADVGEGVQWIGDQVSGIDTQTIVAMKQAFEAAYTTLKDLATAAGDVLGTIGSRLEVTLGTLFNFNSGLTDAESKTVGFTKAIQAVSVALGFISDGFAGVNVATKLITGAFYDMSAAWYQMKSDFVMGSWKDEAIANMQAMGAKAREMYSEASDAALDFKSKGMVAIKDLSKTEEQVNSETLANLKTTFEDKAQLYLDSATTEADYAAKSIELEQSKLEAAQEYAQAAVDGNNGVIDSATMLDLATQNYIATVDEAGQVSVESFNRVESAASEADLSVKDMALNAAKGLGIDVAEALNQVSSGFDRNTEAVRSVADGYSELAAEGLNAGDLLSASLDKLLEGAKSQAEIDNVRKLYNQFGQEGKLSTYQVETGLDAINEKLDKSPALLDETTRAFKELGIISQDEADKQAKAAIANYEIVKNSGQASAEQLSQALESINSKIETSGNAALQSWYNSQQSALGYGGAIKEAEVATERATTAIKDNAEASQDNASAKKAQAEATEKAAAAEEKSSESTIESKSRLLKSIGEQIASVHNQVNAYKEMGATAEQARLAIDKIWQDNMRPPTSFGHLFEMLDNTNRVAREQSENFDRARDAANSMAGALGSATVSSQDLTDAQFALRHATEASIGAHIKMDEQTLDNLKNAIDGARQRMQGLADDAKNTADSLEATLAKMQGNEDRAREIEQTRKLTELEEKLNEAKARGNSEEAAQLNRALSLQKQINAEENKKASADSKASSASSNTTSSNASSQSSASSSSKTITVQLKSDTGTVNATIPESQEALFNAFVKQLQDSKAIAGY